MRRVIAALTFATVLVVPLHIAGTPRALAAPPARSGKCGPPPSPNYKCTNGTLVPASGTFTVALSSSTVRLRGIASRLTFRTRIYLARVTMRNVPKHAQAFKVFASGRVPALTLASRGTLYGYSVATGKWRTIRAITGSGIYAAALR
ncbi:MAG TPA: hypothetical protein VF221_20280 [Chloroflexota bacterium]